jgi:hypothetical protein
MRFAAAGVWLVNFVFSLKTLKNFLYKIKKSYYFIFLYFKFSQLIFFLIFIPINIIQKTSLAEKIFNVVKINSKEGPSSVKNMDLCSRNGFYSVFSLG